ncbi:unnamed protein product [Trichobilharzia regenti]|nr:unnamed protein product [Trichobilharzia regenti]
MACMALDARRISYPLAFPSTSLLGVMFLEVTCVDFHPDPTLQILVSGSKDYTIKLFDFSNPSVKKAQRNIPVSRCNITNPYIYIFE